jgi:polysaccharide deacetylase family protein (PEP-CTERM system associated)
VEASLERFLDLLSRHNISCTFFILGWIADKYPNLVRRVSSCGHEIASHGYGHDLIYDLGPERFRQDIRRAKAILEDLIGTEVQGYRGPGFSITRENSWAFDIIAEEGFQYDATLYPGKHGHGGISGLPCSPFVLLTLDGRELEEYPITLIQLKDYRIAFSGGGYFRLFPFFLVSQRIKWFNRQEIPVMSYFHPRDLDSDTPRLPMSWKRKFKCYINVSSCYRKLEKMLSTHPFGSIRNWQGMKNQRLPKVSLRDCFK